MKKIIYLFLMVLLISCKETTPPSDKQKQEDTVNSIHYSKIIDDSINFTINEKNVVVFETAKDMFTQFNDYPIDEDQLEIISQKPLSIRISAVGISEKELFEDINQFAFIYAIYNTFIHTTEDQITVEAHPMLVNYKTEQKTLLPEYAIKATVTREKALKVLKKYSQAESFDDLVQLKPNNQFRMVGLFGSDLWDKFKHSKQRQQIVEELIK